MDDLPSKKGGWIEGVKETQYERVYSGHFPFILIKTSTLGNLAIFLAC